MPEPIVSRLPETEQAVRNKYRENPGLYAEAPSPIANALLALDIQRSQRGQNPLSARQSQLATRAAITGQAVTPEPETGFWGGLTTNLRQITSAVPRLPLAMYREAMQIGEAPEAVADALTEDTLIKQLSGIAEAPGIRLLPGSFIVGNLDDPKQLVNNPLFTALDILPAAKAAGVGKALGKVGKSAPVQRGIKALGATRPGEFIKEGFGKVSRDVSQLENKHSAGMRESAYGISPTTDPLDMMMREAGTLRQKYPSIAEDRRVELTRQMESDTLPSSLAGDELAFVRDVRDLTDRFGWHGVSMDLLRNIDGEFYDLDTGGKILRARKKAHVAEVYGSARQAIEDPTVLSSADDILDRMNEVTYDETLKPAQKIQVLEGYAHALDQRGIDARLIHGQIRQYRNTANKKVVYSDDNFRDFITSARSSGDLGPRTTAVDIPAFLDDLKKYKADPQVTLLRNQIQKGRWNEAKATAGNISRRKKFQIPGVAEAIDELARQRNLSRYMRKTANYSEKGVAKAAKSAERVVASNPPSRFQKVIDDRLNESLIAKYSDDPDFDTMLPYLKERNYGFLSREGLIPEKEVKAMQLQMKRTWQDMKAAGIDPVFVHKVSETQIGSIRYPRVLERIPRPTQTVKRSWNLTPTIDDATVALTHQGLEWLARRGSEEFIDEIMTRWGKTEAELIEQYLPAARVAAKSSEDVLHVAQRMMAKEWGKYDPTGIINWPSPRIKRWAGNDTWLPKTVSNNIQRMHTPPGGRLTAISDPVMRVFRTSLLPLSLRWHLYNFIGGGVLLTAGTDPTVWKYLSEARNLTKSGLVPEDIPRGMGTVPRDVMEWNTSGSIQKPLEQIFHYKGGQTLRRLWDEAQSARTKFGNVIEKSYEVNGMVDDMYRTMAYLYGKDKGLTKGMTKEAAHKAGVEVARKVFQQWDRMTPIERTIMRFIFPFYGWTAHITKFVMQYPFDHPIRTAVLGSFARNELEDQGTGIPERFLNMFFLGDTDKDGNVHAINIGGMNPFADVANNFTLAGFLGQTNPLITTAFEAAGVDLANGGPELFPNMQYDAETGRLKFKGRNPAMLLAENILPQSRILLGFADSSSEFQQLLRTNPDAAARLMFSQAGLPVVYRNINVPQEIAKAEVVRDEAQTNALNRSLKSGNWSEAERFPGLAPILASIRQMQESGQLTNFQPSAGQSAIALAQKALLQMVNPQPLPTELPTRGSE